MKTEKSIVLVVLVGGKGSRLASVVSDRPKPLADVQGSPFLKLLLKKWSKHFEIKAVYLLAGHMGEQMIEFAKTLSFEFPVFTLVEPYPLGTGGAIASFLKYAEGTLDPLQRLVITNGDTYFNYEGDFESDFRSLGNDKIGLVVSDGLADDRYDRLLMDGNNEGLALSIRSPGSNDKGLVSVGLYFGLISMFSKWVRKSEQSFSFEKSCLPLMVESGVVRAYRRTTNFIDFGTPESFAEIQLSGDIES